MAKLCDVLPEQSKTVEAIYAAWKRRGDDGSRPCNSLGASQVGDPCERAIWYAFRHCSEPSFSGRMYRLFDRGNFEEPRVVDDLKAIGCTVHATDDTGEQFLVKALGGHLRGYLDGCVLGVPEAPKTWHVLEVKTHGAKSWRDLDKRGVKASKPKHYAQMMLYMHLTGMRRALYIAVNKDTEDLYAERIRWSKAESEALMERAKRVITQSSPPARISENADCFQCRFCDARTICHPDEGGPVLPVPRLSCRQCCHAEARMDGERRWVCYKRGKALSFEEQLRPCKEHRVLPELLEGHDPIDCKDGMVTYQGNDFTWKHGNADEAFSSAELMVLNAKALRNGMVRAAKETLGARVVDEDHDILSRCNDGKLVWSGALGAEQISAGWQRCFGEPLPERPIRTQKSAGVSAAEYKHGRVVIAFPSIKLVEIRVCEQ